MFSFVTFASFLAGLSDLSLRNENDNSVKTETDENPRFKVILSWEGEIKCDNEATFKFLSNPPENRGLTYHSANISTISHLWKDISFSIFQLQSLQMVTNIVLLPLTGAYCDESLALLAARTEQKTGPIQNCLHHNSQSEQPCAIISKPPRAVGVWRNNVNNCQIRRHLLLLLWFRLCSSWGSDSVLK